MFSGCGLLFAKVSSVYTYTKVFTTNQLSTSYNPYTAAIADGWNGTSPITITITVNTGIYLVGTASAAAISITASFPAQSTINILNNGYILGKGGNGGGYDYATDGGTAIKVSTPITITNNGTISGGGGGGSGVNREDFAYAYGGGGGAPLGLAGVGTVSSLDGVGATLLLAGAGKSSAPAVNCGAGGEYGQAGASGVAGQNVSNGLWYYPSGSGTAGKYIDGNSYVTWLVTGTRLGTFS